MCQKNLIYIHPTAEVSPNAQVGSNTKIWNYTQVREDSKIGEHCIIGKNVYIDFGVRIGSYCKIQNNCSLYHGIEIEDGVFIGPHVIFTNDKIPRAINAEGSLKSSADWIVGHILICYGASIGAGSIILPNLRIGRFAMVAAGSVVTHDVADYQLVAGNPARPIGKINESGNIIERV